MNNVRHPANVKASSRGATGANRSAMTRFSIDVADATYDAACTVIGTGYGEDVAPAAFSGRHTLRGIERSLPPSVFSERHGFQMIWINAPSVPAEMVYGQAIWDRTVSAFVCNPMRALPSKSSITIGRDIALPNVASIGVHGNVLFERPLWLDEASGFRHSGAPACQP